MTKAEPALLYVGARLPSRSETFVYNEVFGLQKRGWRVLTASVRRPHTFQYDPDLAALREHSRVAYSNTLWRLPLALAAYPKTFAQIFNDMGRRSGGTVQKIKRLAQGLAALSLAHQLRYEGIIHIHAHLAHSATTLAMDMAHAWGIGFSFTGHAADLFVSPQDLDVKLGRAAGVVAISHWHKEFYYARCPDLAPVPVIRCGVDMERFAPGDARADGQPLHILSVGRMVPKKGFVHLLRALALWRDGQSDPVFKVSLIGAGSEETSLRTLCAELGLQEQVRFLGEQPHNIVRDMMKQADIFALACVRTDNGDQDGIPVALMEAMACGMPVISGDLAPIRELVRDGDTGLTVDAVDHQALAAALDRLARDRDLRKRLGQAGRQWVGEEFSQTTNLGWLEDFFRTMIHKNL